MEWFLVVCCIAWCVGYMCYQNGKRTGSRKGFNVGRHLQRRRRH